MNSDRQVIEKVGRDVANKRRLEGCPSEEYQALLHKVIAARRDPPKNVEKWARELAESCRDLTD